MIRALADPARSSRNATAPSPGLTGAYYPRMAFGLVAFHYPSPEHRDELVQRMQAAAGVMRTVEGCLGVSVWEARESDALVSTGTFVSEEAWTQAARAVLEAGVDFDYDERELRPRAVHFLVQPD